MSASSTNTQLRLTSAVVFALMGLAACSGSDTVPDRVSVPELETIEAPVAEVIEAEPTVDAADDRRASRRERRANRDRDDDSDRRERRRRRDEPAEELAEETLVVEIPELATQSFQRALGLMQAGDWIEAEFELEQLILEYDQFPGPFVNLAIVYQQDGRFDEAREAIEIALSLKQDHAPAHNRLGMLLREQGEFIAAESAYRRAIEADPAYAIAHYNLAVLLDLYLRREGEALELYERYQELAPEPDVAVGRWIIDLRRRLGVTEAAPQAAQESDA